MFGWLKRLFKRKKKEEDSEFYESLEEFDALRDEELKEEAPPEDQCRYGQIRNKS